MKPVQIIQGGQYGSEAKGAIAAYLCLRDNVDFAVRTGATNAGHTVYHNGKPYKMQQLPVGWVNPSTKLVIGAGSLVDVGILEREIAMLEADGVKVHHRLFIDQRAYLHEESASTRSMASGRHHRIGATGKGCSEAFMDRIRLRGIRDLSLSRTANGLPLFDTVRMLNSALDDGAKIQLEGTQGTLLDITHGPYPYTTHKQTLPAVWLAEAGIATTVPQDVVMVVRTCPIRVAGNSGPLPEETSWPTLARLMNHRMSVRDLEPVVAEWAIAEFEEALAQVAEGWQVVGLNALRQEDWKPADRVTHAAALSEMNKEALAALRPEALAELSKLFEFTTVTRKLRRVANISNSDLGRAAMLCRPSRVVVTFMNYIWPEVPVAERGSASIQLAPAMRSYLQRIADVCRAPISHVSWGPETHHIKEVSIHNGRR